jgi:hypothetical protein
VADLIAIELKVTPDQVGKHERPEVPDVGDVIDGRPAAVQVHLSPVGDGALVIFERDGTPLPASEGPLALVSLRDTQPGPRHVKWLAKIEIRRIGD